MTDKIEQIFLTLAKKLPEPCTELHYTNHFTLLIAIILSAQSTDVGVNKATAPLFKIIKTPQDILNLGIEKLKSHIKTLGLYNNKAKNIIALAEMLLDKYQSNIPKNIEELEKLPGVGSKTAKVYLNCAYKLPYIAVDTHVFRVSNRLGIINTKNVKQAETILNQIIPDRWKLHAHHWLILHGRYVCKARKPDCEHCIIKQFCDFYSSIRQKINIDEY